MPKKIVVVDDEQEILEIVKATLKTKGYYIYAADNGEDGWRLIQQQHPDLAIIDLKMPKVSGLELTRRIHASKDLRNTPIIVISGIGHETGKPDEFWREGLKADDFISKPFDPLDLLGRVEYLFRRTDYVSTQAAAKSKPTPTPAESPPVKELPPETVVRNFVEAWNTQDFKREFLSLDEEMTGGLPMQDYVRRRMQCYQEEHGDYHTRKLAKVEKTSVNRNLSIVEILREDKKGARTTKSRQTYALRKTTEGWRIVSVRSKPA